MQFTKYGVLNIFYIAYCRLLAVLHGNMLGRPMGREKRNLEGRKQYYVNLEVSQK